jgi:hypothetical protein
MDSARGKLLASGVIISICGVALLVHANSRLDFENVDRGMANGWTGLASVGLALFGPSRYTVRSIMMATAALAALLAILANLG